MKKAPFTAVSLRNLMTVIVIVAFVATGAGFYYALTQFETYATQVHQVVVTAGQYNNVGATPAANGQQATLSPILNNFLATPATYLSQATQSINAYAQKSGVPVANVTAANGAVVSAVTVTFSGPVDYAHFLTFLTYIEHNLPKMYVTALALQHVDGASTVNVTSLTIGVAT